MSRNKKYLILFGFVASATSFAQEPTASQFPPQTKLEQFQAKPRSVVISGFTKVGTSTGRLGSSIAVEARELTDGSNSTKLHGISITVSDARRGGRQSTSYIDVDEIDSLEQAIDYIERVVKSVTQLKDYRAEYRTKGNLVISRFTSDRTGQATIAVQSGSQPQISAFFDLEDLPKIKDLVAAAQSTLTTAK